LATASLILIDIWQWTPFAFLLSWNDFFFALILTNTRAITAPLADYQAIGFQSVDLGALAATSTIVLIPTALVVAFFQKQLVKGMTMGAVKADHQPQLRHVSMRAQATTEASHEGGAMICRISTPPLRRHGCALVVGPTQ
jgi:hypothetical protein